MNLGVGWRVIFAKRSKRVVGSDRKGDRHGSFGGGENGGREGEGRGGGQRRPQKRGEGERGSHPEVLVIVEGEGESKRASGRRSSKSVEGHTICFFSINFSSISDLSCFIVQRVEIYAPLLPIACLTEKSSDL